MINKHWASKRPHEQHLNLQWLMGEIDALKKVVTPVKTGVQEIHHKVKRWIPA